MVLLEPEGRPGWRVCAAGTQLRLETAVHEASACEFSLEEPATQYSPLSLWATPPIGRGFLLMPLKDIVDQAILEL